MKAKFTMEDHDKANIIYDKIVDCLIGEDFILSKLALSKIGFNLFSITPESEIETECLLEQANNQIKLLQNHLRKLHGCK